MTDAQHAAVLARLNVICAVLIAGAIVMLAAVGVAGVAYWQAEHAADGAAVAKQRKAYDACIAREAAANEAYYCTPLKPSVG